jgi:hypothetical protein
VEDTCALRACEPSLLGFGTVLAAPTLAAAFNSSEPDSPLDLCITLGRRLRRIFSPLISTVCSKSDDVCVLLDYGSWFSLDSRTFDIPDELLHVSVFFLFCGSRRMGAPWVAQPYKLPVLSPLIVSKLVSFVTRHLRSCIPQDPISLQFILISHPSLIGHCIYAVWMPSSLPLARYHEGTQDGQSKIQCECVGYKDG